MVTLFRKAVSSLKSGPVFQVKSNHIEVIETSAGEIFIKTPGVYENILQVKKFSTGIDFVKIQPRQWDYLRQVFNSSDLMNRNYRDIAISFCEKYHHNEDYKPAVQTLLPQILPAIMTSII